jgi:5'-methylthioadenosine phosphorylase
MTQKTLGIIGGSGLYEMAGLSNQEAVQVETPFGAPSDALVVGWLEDVRMVFLPRHGRGHRLMPSELPFRANIYAMKKLGVDRIVAVSAVGSMREDIAPGDMVVVDQFFDRTLGARPSTFFGDGCVAHVHFADPVCGQLWQITGDACEAVGVRTHRGGTYLCMEGPAFSTRAESKTYRRWGVDVIGMTNLQEAKLAREAEICYTTLALATDYDCWHETEADVSVEAVIQVLLQNVENARAILREVAKRVPAEGCEHCSVALRHAIITHRDAITPEAKQRLGLLIEKYL